MITKLNCSLTPACTDLEKLNGRTITAADGRVLSILLNADQCRVDEPNNRVILGFAAG
jgi:hypothetical protein